MKIKYLVRELTFWKHFFNELIDKNGRRISDFDEMIGTYFLLETSFTIIYRAKVF